jgi:hypothetical protein
MPNCQVPFFSCHLHIIKEALPNCKVHFDLWTAQTSSKLSTSCLGCPMPDFFFQSTETSAPKNQNNSQLFHRSLPNAPSPRDLTPSFSLFWLNDSLEPFQILNYLLKSSLNIFIANWKVSSSNLMSSLSNFMNDVDLKAIVMDWKSMNGIPWILRWNKVHPKSHL